MGRSGSLSDVDPRDCELDSVSGHDVIVTVRHYIRGVKATNE